MTGEGSHDFARARRIVKTDEFSSVFRLRPTQKTAHFVLYTRPNSLPHARLGVVAAKRFAPRAVTRNTIKRVTRELFRPDTPDGQVPRSLVQAVLDMRRRGKTLRRRQHPCGATPLDGAGCVHSG